MYNTKTVINVHDNLITNNTSPYGQEIFIKWKDAYNLYPQFDNNDWGDENPNDSSVIDPNNVTSRSKVSTTTTSNLFAKLNVDLLTKYRDLIEDYFSDNSLDNLKKRFDDAKPQKSNNNPKSNNIKDSNNQNTINTNNTDNNLNANSKINTPQIINATSNEMLLIGNSTSAGDSKNAYELNKSKSVAKQTNLDIKYAIAGVALVFILLAIGYRKYQKEE
jgi:hypothetical protein